MKKMIYTLEDSIYTNFSGHKQLITFYNWCLLLPPESHIHISFKDVNWFDGNLSALLSAIVHQLDKKLGHTFSTDEEAIKTKFNVLFRNGFLQSEKKEYDNRKSTVPMMSFDCSDKEGFYSYIENELLAHRGIPSHISQNLKERIKDDLLEIFANTNHHANTTDPFFVCGQYYPKNKNLVFTMVDLGDGFLPRINRATKGQVTTQLQAILWAIKGNSSKIALDECPGSLGITSMLSYCKSGKGVLQIFSGDAYWASDYENTIFRDGRILPAPFLGTTINLYFNHV